jgi:BirA family biotin operon repressor/biotin-[acetyl-CoA-carboxylase] ligase
VTAEFFSIRVGLAVAEALESALPGLPPILLKWPNDLYLGDRKLGGILCEARWQGGELAWIVAGIGLNVRDVLPEEVRSTAVALASVAPDATPERLAGPVAERVASDAGTGGQLEPRELAAFTARDFLWGRRLREPIAGVATGIDAGGGLRVNTGPDGIRVALTGTVLLA